MNYYIQQSIHINLIRIDGISNSSVFQIGSAGVIKPSAYLYNTGGYTAAAPKAETPEELASESAVPLLTPPSS